MHDNYRKIRERNKAKQNCQARNGYWGPKMTKRSKEN